ncbi:TRAP transporter small permease [Lentisphaera profundi]|uniref:TRAP transporter small permease n=1 Tax=Lentisphaera profundi TaxID=1658616 RepID=A0ABY7VNC7_9BACT|nr:TRAP transporter small permease [Lentisphaera profundi]WDE95615.1 TRAP transporter small permease [Lentisphaera profundi]
MLSKLKTCKDGLMKVLDLLLITMMAMLVIVVLYQILARSLNLGGTAICSELAQFLLVWITLLGGSLAFAKNAHLGIDYFAGKLKGNKRLWLDIFGQICIAFFGSYLLLFGGAKLVTLTLRFDQLSSAMGIPMAYIYTALPISGLFISLVALETILEKVNAMKEAQ